MVRLECPLCGVTVADGPEPEPGACPGCGARLAGGGDSPPEATALALAQLGVEGVDPDLLARALFALDPDGPPGRRVAITSDRRDGFYRWWLFVHEGEGPAADLLHRLAGG